jgi:hypothetical protein
MLGSLPQTLGVLPQESHPSQPMVQQLWVRVEVQHILLGCARPSHKYMPVRLQPQVDFTREEAPCRAGTALCCALLYCAWVAAGGKAPGPGAQASKSRGRRIEKQIKLWHTAADYKG